MKLVGKKFNYYGANEINTGMKTYNRTAIMKTLMPNSASSLTSIML